MKYSSSFTHDLKFGEIGEDWANQLFKGDFKVEVKMDTMAHVTGNVFIEYSSRGKPSGIAVTDADYYLYIIAEFNHAIILNVENLKERLRFYYKHNMYIRNGGDDDTSVGFLVPINELLGV
jgi:uncharacterized protein YuzE